MLQPEDQTVKIKIDQIQQIATLPIMRQQKVLKDSQLDFEKNYPKNIFIPMIEYLAEIGLKEEYEQEVGSREEFQGKNVVSLSLIHKLMGAEWFRQSVEMRVVVSTICNKILMNSKIKKKLFHLYIVKNLFQVYDQDLKEFKKRISKLANSISELTYVEDQLFEFPSSILYLLRLFYQLISPHSTSTLFLSPDQNLSPTPSKHTLQQHSIMCLSKTPSQSYSQVEALSSQNIKISKHGSKQEYKHYIRKIINHFNSDGGKKDLSVNFKQVERAIRAREKQVIEKYGLPLDVPGWGWFIQKVVSRCYQCYKKSGKITHAMMNDWIGDFRQFITSVTLQPIDNIQPQQIPSKKQSKHSFKPLILQYFPHKL